MCVDLVVQPQKRKTGILIFFFLVHASEHPPATLGRRTSPPVQYRRVRKLTARRPSFCSLLLPGFLVTSSRRDRRESHLRPPSLLISRPEFISPFSLSFSLVLDRNPPPLACFHVLDRREDRTDQGSPRTTGKRPSACCYRRRRHVGGSYRPFDCHSSPW